MRQVGVGKACAAAALVAVICSAISAGAVQMANRDKVAMHIPDPQKLAAACTVVRTVHMSQPNTPIMLHPEIFKPGQMVGDPRFSDQKIFYMIREPKPGDS